ncbi:hypothetical protein Sjap_000736 [Stephania japonica]|uniref:Uncharacterized protein n=1 Tax=Stephania japonica TaxID=461633 RepID=A0AAP0KIN5_9MAGN
MEERELFNGVFVIVKKYFRPSVAHIQLPFIGAFCHRGLVTQLGTDGRLVTGQHLPMVRIRGRFGIQPV